MAVVSSISELGMKVEVVFLRDGDAWSHMIF